MAAFFRDPVLGGGAFFVDRSFLLKDWCFALVPLNGFPECREHFWSMGTSNSNVNQIVANVEFAQQMVDLNVKYSRLPG